MEVLKRGDMFVEQTITLTISGKVETVTRIVSFFFYVSFIRIFLIEPSPERRYINWLRNCYEEVWEKILLSIEKSRPTIQLQALTTALKLLAQEGKTPLEPTGTLGYYLPLHRLKPILMSLLSPEKDNINLINRFQEIAGYSDALYYTWKCLPSLTPKRQPREIYIKNLLELIDKLPLPKDTDGKNISNGRKYKLHMYVYTYMLFSPETSFLLFSENEICENKQLLCGSNGGKVI